MDDRTKTVMTISSAILGVIQGSEEMSQSDLQGCIEAQVMNAYDAGKKAHEKEEATTDIMNKSFEISSVCREDLTEYFTAEQIAKIDDNDMAWLARKMGNNFCDCCYWEALRLGVEHILENK